MSGFRSNASHGPYTSPAPYACDNSDTSYDDPAPRLAETVGKLGRMRYARPPVSFEGGPENWSRPPGPWGTDSPRWA
ncbi:hypothetical protein [Streptomyces sp. 2A115]|uniref:hypothetical protein n=1 Tax=Streptomyces sp. 2A115 TaxID=3457439 RepID=UPI003FD5944C